MVAMQDKNGFSLIFISVLLTVAALIFVSLIPGQEAGDINQKNINNTAKLERVEEAMRSFMAANGRRPCPADGQYPENTANFGVEAVNPGSCNGGTPGAPLGPDTVTGLVVGGTIPTKTLGLPDDYAYDDYGRRFTYIVDVRATNSAATAVGESTTNYCGYLQNNIQMQTDTTGIWGGVRGIWAYTPAITIENTNGSTVIDHTMYAYISHGASGYGAWPAQGSATTLPTAESIALRINSGSTDPDMQVNAGVNADFSGNFTNVKVKRDRVTSNLPSGGTTGFDDFVWYRQDMRNTCCLGASCLQTGFVAKPVPGLGGQAGWSVATGDVNGDGIPDLIIGAYFTTPLFPNAAINGAVYVVFGTRLGFPDPLPLGNLNGSNGFELYGGRGAFLGFSVATGDVNGDGIADLIVSAPRSTAADGSGFAGSVYVIFGGKGPGGTWANTPYIVDTGNGKLIDGIQGIRFDGATAWDFIGTALATGDINGDGYADIIIGAYSANNSAGYAYVVFGGKTGANTNNSTGTLWTSCTPCTLNPGYGNLIDGTQGVRFDGVSNYYVYSATANSYEPTVAGATLATGDVNGDGYADIVIGAPCTNCTDNHAYVVFGKNTSPTTSSFLSGLSGASTTITTHGNTTATVNPSSSYTGLMTCQSLSASNIPAGTYISTCGTGSDNASKPCGLCGTLVCGWCGTAPCGPSNPVTTRNPGPLNPVATCTSNNIALSKTVTGSSAAPLSLASTPLLVGTNTLIDGTQGIRLDGISPYYFGDSLGGSVATGDVNGDGIPDLIVGAASEDSSVAPGGGATYVLFGKGAGTPMLASTTGTTSGSSILNITDSYSGLMVGDTLASPPGTATGIPTGTTISSCSGSSTLGTPCTSGPITLSGPANATSNKIIVASTPAATGTGTFFDGTQGFRIDGIYGDQWIGKVVAAGDINGDGYADIIMGTPGGHNNGVWNLGYTYVVFGKNAAWGPAGYVVLNTGSGNLIDGTQGFRLDGALAGDGTGVSITTGDINGDGIPDIIIGAPSASAGAGDGYVYTYFGHKNSPNDPWPGPSFPLNNL